MEKQIGNFAKAIGMGIITETTKSSLLALEAERSRLETELSKATLSERSFTKEEIRYALRELSGCGYGTQKQKEALLNAFVERVEISPEGLVKVMLNLCGTETEAGFSMKDLKEVRINEDSLRH